MKMVRKVQSNRPLNGAALSPFIGMEMADLAMEEQKGYRDVALKGVPEK